MMHYLLFYLILNHFSVFITCSGEHQSSGELRNEPPDHVIPYSEHENPPEPSTKPEYLGPGVWAKPPLNRNVSLDFTPTRLYAQVRHSDIVKRVPREQALKEAKNDEERENIGRLREVVKKQKVNTYYTEEGYEDAAYDHAGHIRDADFDEKYDKNVLKKDGDSGEGEDDDDHKADDKNDNGDDSEENFESTKLNTISPYKGFYRTWEESGINPRGFAESGIWELERDLNEKNKETAKQAETEVPENLRNLVDNSESDENESDEKLKSSYEESYEKFKSSFDDDNDDDDEENDISDSAEPEKKSGSTFRIVAAAAEPRMIEEHFTRPQNDSVITQNLILKPETLISTTEEAPSISETSKSHYPSLSQVYETWKRRGVEEKYDESSPEVREGEHNLISNSNEEYQSKEESQEASDELETAGKLNKKYVLLVRKPVVMPSNHSNPKNLYLKKKKHFSSSEELTVMRPPTISRSRQVTYADFLPKTYDNPIKPSMTQESGSLEASDEDNNTPAPILLYRYQRQPHYRNQPARQDLKNYLLPSIKLFPPSPMSWSEYAQYNTEARNENIKPQHNLRPGISKNRLVFRIGKKTPVKRRRYSIDDKKLNYEKVPLKGVKSSQQRTTERKFIGPRQKRNTKDLLNDAPRVVEQVVNDEINVRFPDNHEDDEDERSESMSIEETEEDEKNKEEKKVEVDVPEFNFAGVNQDINDNQSNKQKIQEPKSKFDYKKYPFYNNNEIPRSSPLKYIINPHQIPQKTLGGSEFYDSRDKYLRCEEIDPDLSKVVPEEEEPEPDRGPETNLPRLYGLGDKISCYKAKYFDKNPLDNPLFAERRIESPSIPEEFNPFMFMARISGLSSDSDENVHRRVSRKPEIIDIRPLESRKNEIVDQDQNKYGWSQPERPTAWSNHARRHRSRSKTTTAVPFMPYQRLVYEDVMGTIKNLTNMYRQQPSTYRPHGRVSLRLRKRPRITNYSQSQEKKDEVIYITTQSPDLSNTVSPPTWGRYKKIKFIPYRTNKVTYRTRKMTRPARGVSNNTVDYFKTVRVHKREVDASDLNVGESQTIMRRNDTLRRRWRRPGNYTVLESTPESTKKIVYTIIDRMNNMKARGTEKYEDFTTESTTSTTATTVRNEPRYTAIRKFDGDIYKIKSVDNPKDLTKFDERYDVHEETQDEQAEDPVTIKYEGEVTDNYSDDDESSGDSEKLTGTTLYNDESDNDDESEGNYKKEDGEDEESREQVEKHKSDTDNNSSESKEGSDEEESSGDSNNYHGGEKGFFTMSDHEKDFERYSSRPFSPFESFHDAKYADLGPRINKPSFYHPPFESVGSAKSDDSESEEDQSKEYSPRKPKYSFPWHEDDEDASEESRRHEKITGVHEFPWERRARLRAMRRAIDRKLADEHHPSASMTRFKRVHPWDHHSKFKFNKFGRSFWSDDGFDSDGMSSEMNPTKFSHHEKSKSKTSEEIIEEVINDEENEKELENTTNAATTTTPQIPATSADVTTATNKPTTPTLPVMTSREVYTVRPRSRRRGNVRYTEVSVKDQENSESKVEVSSTPRTYMARTSKRRGLPKKNNSQDSKVINSNNNSNDNNSNNYRRRLRMTSSITTTAKPLRRKLSNNPDNKSTTPATRKIEHRSKVSKEEIITKTSFPLMKQISGKNDNNTNNGTLKNEMVQKVSIVTKETPEHIFQTKEIDENGKKNKYISIIPNNSTHTSFETEESSDDESIDRIEIEDLYNSRNNDQESLTLDVSIPLNDKVKLTEHESKKMMTSVSWISENYNV